MDEQRGKLHCVLLIALVALLLQALLPASFIGGFAVLTTLTVVEHSPDLVNRLLVLAGMVFGLMALSVMIMLLFTGITAFLGAKKARTRTCHAKDLNPE